MKKLYTLTENDLHILVEKVTKRIVSEMEGGIGGGATSTMGVGMTTGNGNGNGYEYDAPVNSGQPITRNFWTAGNEEDTCERCGSKKEKKNTNLKCK